MRLFISSSESFPPTGTTLGWESGKPGTSASTCYNFMQTNYGPPLPFPALCPLRHSCIDEQLASSCCHKA
ncbi:hypothetical protein Bpfe_028300 [Biomphalaria pfeifferi]|uniref:Uncharacterized protein n=1 Tax=Biomphalaria pfeifferi TaxID=112525 RepID=A0AAD8EW89_BIOPF|nr:hypothetical protein Bpfe_028300 [Biomphalaria pfeifferi]